MIDDARLRQRVVELQAEYEQRLGTLVGIPTVSMDPGRGGEMDACVGLAGGYLREAGARVDVIDTGGFPLVVGRFIQDPSFPTVTIYNHLDVQPAEAAEGWKTPPFTMTSADEPGGQRRWFARGTTDDKGPALAAYYGARLALETGARVNIQFLWELEEEIGSPHFAAGLASAIAGDAAAGRAPFATDSVVVSDTIWTAAGHPSISYGLRGLMGFTIALETGAKDVHSGTTGGVARNPIGELSALVAAMYDARTGKVKIPGFYGGVRKISAAERKAFGRAGFSRKRFAAAHELGSLRPTRTDVDALAALIAAPTLEVHGLVGGYAGPGIKTIVPHRAELKLSTRLVPDQKPDRVFKLIKAFVKKHLPDAVVTHEASLEPYLAPIGGPYHAAAAAAVRATFGKEPAFVREGGSIGAVLTMQRLLHAPVIFLGLSLPEHGYHAINENFDWRQAAGGMEMFCRYFHQIGAGEAGPAAARGGRRAKHG
ncbi:MAG TPA: M20/M25/M40 family metallo-hydrolase [Polyangia bacterium]|nr:M20/M25/M40 family metallo-hydrolase [Polyangia bacterium]